MRSLRNTWQCAVSHVFNVSGVDVQFVCSVTDNNPLDVAIIDKRMKFLKNLKFTGSQVNMLYCILCICELVSTSYLMYKRHFLLIN